VKAADLPPAAVQAHWDVLCNVLHFVGKKRVVASEEQAQQIRAKNKAAQIERQKEQQSERQAAELITPGNPKKIFKKLAMAGKGGFGMVFSATDPSRERVAIKRMPHTSEREKRMNLREISFLQVLNCPPPCARFALLFEELRSACSRARIRTS
jgi:hypothetical protein